MALPLVGLVLGSLRSASGIGLGNYWRLFNQPVPGFTVTPIQTLGRSIIVAVIAMGLAVLVGGCIALALSGRPRRRWLRRAQTVADSAFMLPAGISAVTVGVGLFITLNRPPYDLRASFWLVPIAQALVALPLVSRAVLPVLRAVAPGQRQAAAVLGASPGRIMWSVDLPIMARLLAWAAAHALAASLGEFGATAFLARPESVTLPVAIYQLMARPGLDNLGTGLAGAVLLGAITSALVAVAEARRPILPGVEM
jgi:thiamine transport system permease protein